MSTASLETTVSAEEKMSLACRTLLGLHKVGINYCLWKSFDRLGEGIRGETDFDLLMEAGKEQEVFEYLIRNAWVEVNSESWRRFPDVYDFIQYDSQYNTFIHFHVHFKLVMGEKNVKSLSLPLEDLYLRTAVEVGGIFYAMPELEVCVYILRLTLKITWRDYARVIRRQDPKLVYKNLIPEFQNIRQRCDRSRLESLLEHPSLSFIDSHLVLETFEDFYSLTFGRRHQLKKLIASYRRYGYLERSFVSLRRSREKRTIGHGKTLLGRGLSFAFCGADGSGKTTLVDSIETLFSQHLKVARYYMGGNNLSRDLPRKIFSVLFDKPFRGVRKLCNILHFKLGAGFSEKLYFGVTNYLKAREKYDRYQKSRIAIEQGALVLYERFPVFPDGGDGVAVSDEGYFQKYEQRIYDRMNPPDVTFVLMVDSEVAVERKADHRPSVIREKTAAFRNFVDENPNKLNLVVIDGNASMDRVAQIVVDRVNLELRGDS
jgi:thymidylate kinase